MSLQAQVLYAVVPGHLFQCVYELMTKTRHFEVSKKGGISEEDYGVKVMVTQSFLKDTFNSN